METRRQNTISITPLISFDTTLSGTSILGNPNYPSIYIILFPQFINNSGSITGLSQLNAVSKQQEEGVDLPAHKQYQDFDNVENSSNQTILPICPLIPICPSSAIDKSVNSRDLWEAFSEYYSNTIDI